MVTIRNEGGQSANLTNYRLGAADIGTNTTMDEALAIGATRACRRYSFLGPGEVLVVRPKTESNECGYPFTLDSR
jgi:hypothetical protein